MKHAANMARAARESARDVPPPADAPERVTCDPARASVIRDPETGRLSGRDTEIFRKWRAGLAS